MLSSRFQQSAQSRGPAALVLFYPSLRGELPFTQAALSGWRKLCPGGSWAPLPLDLAVAAAAVLHHLGHEEASTALLLSFDCYLRIGEVVGLRCSDVVLPGDTLLGVRVSAGSVNLRDTKTGKDQSVVMHEELVTRLVARCRRAARAVGGGGWPPFSNPVGSQPAAVMPFRSCFSRCAAGSLCLPFGEAWRGLFRLSPRAALLCGGPAAGALEGRENLPYILTARPFRACEWHHPPGRD